MGATESDFVRGARWASVATGFEATIDRICGGRFHYTWVESVPDAAPIHGSLRAAEFLATFRPVG